MKPLQANGIVPRSNPPRWIGARAMDLFFMFSFVWAIPLLACFAAVPRNKAIPALLPLTVLLSQGHKYSPHILFFSVRSIRDHVLQQRPHIIRELALLVGVPVLVAAFVALLFLNQFPPAAFFLPISILAFVYTVWTYFHFSQQSYGVVRLYRRLNGSTRDATVDRYEFAMVTTVAFFMTALIFTFSNARLDFYLFFLSPLQMPPLLKIICLGSCVLLFFHSIYFYRKRHALNTPVALAIAHFFFIAAALTLLPIFLGLLLVSVSHWTQAIYLASMQFARDQPEKLGSSIQRVCVVVIAFLVISSLLYVAYDFVHNELPIVGNFGMAVDFQKEQRWLVTLGLLYFGLNTGLNYTHFYLDRFIYKGNPLLGARTLPTVAEPLLSPHSK